MEAGRKEADVKIRLKDNQLVRVQKKLKDLEAKVLEWEKDGKVPAGSAGSAAVPPRPAVPAATPTAPAAASVPIAAVPPPVVPAVAPVASSSAAPTGGPAPPTAGGSAPITRAPAARSGAPAGIPRRPSLATPTAPASSAPAHPAHPPVAPGRGLGCGPSNQCSNVCRCNRQAHRRAQDVRGPFRPEREAALKHTLNPTTAATRVRTQTGCKLCCTPTSTNDAVTRKRG